MQLHETEPDIDSIRDSIIRSYDGNPRDERQRIIDTVATVEDFNPELDGSFIPNQNLWMEFQNYSAHLPSPTNFGGFVCSSVFGTC